MEKPDKEIEEFWLGYKISMSNFYKVKNIPPRPIEYWSSILNKLQSQENYLKIERNIRDYMLLYSIDIIRYGSYYHGRILQTNMKRWNKICNEHNSIGKSTLNNNQKKILTIFEIFIKFSDETDKSILEELNHIFSQVELYIIYDIISPLIIFAVEHNKIFILELLNDIIDVYPLLWEKYPETHQYRMKFRKMIDLIKK
jgi:hypothetical protein